MFSNSTQYYTRLNFKSSVTRLNITLLGIPATSLLPPMPTFYTYTWGIHSQEGIPIQCLNSGLFPLPSPPTPTLLTAGVRSPENHSDEPFNGGFHLPPATLMPSSVGVRRREEVRSEEYLNGGLPPPSASTTGANLQPALSEELNGGEVPPPPTSTAGADLQEVFYAELNGEVLPPSTSTAGAEHQEPFNGGPPKRSTLTANLQALPDKIFSGDSSPPLNLLQLMAKL